MSTLKILGTCPHDCPDTCGMETTVADGVAVAIRGSRTHPITRGFLCTKVNRYLERTYHRDRLMTPLRRVGPKGSGEFAPCSWDEAIAEICAGLQRRIAHHGPSTVLPYSYAGTMGAIQGGSMASRFFHRLGASLLDRTICSTAGMEGWKATYGSSLGTDPQAVAESELVLLWGTNTLTANPHLWPFVRQARDRGAPVVCIDPVRTRTAQASDVHLAPRPGTDGALALGLMHVLFRDGFIDEDFLRRRTFGWEALRDRALGEWSPGRAAEICDLPEERIEWLARLYGSTTRSYIRVNYGLQRHAGGGMAVRTISLLPAITGAWQHRGGGATLSTSGAFHLDKAALERPDWIAPGTRTINMNELGNALTTGPAEGPPITATLVYNSNPAAVAPDLHRVREGLLREDLLTVVIEQFPTDTADYADWVLPATTQLEHWDVHTTYGHHVVGLNQPAIAPLGECLPNTEVFRRLARGMGMNDPAFLDTDEQLIEQSLNVTDPEMAPVTMEALREHGWVELSYDRLPYCEGHLLTPTGLIQCEAPQLADQGFDTLPTYIPPAEASNLVLSQRFPLTLLTPPAHEFMNSSFVNVDVLAKAAGQPTLLIHPEDAQTRGIVDGAMVTSYNDRGSFTCAAEVTDAARPGTVVCYGVRWIKGSRAGHINDTTSQRLSDLGGGATFYDNAVQVSLID